MSRITKTQRAEAIERLREALAPGIIIDVRVLSVSSSGMYAHVSAKHLDNDGSWRVMAIVYVGNARMLRRNAFTRRRAWDSATGGNRKALK